MKKIMVTGSNGLLGQKILEQAKEWAEFSFCAISRSPDKFGCKPSISFNCVDITNPTELDYIVSLEKPDIIIHTAAMTKPDECEKNKESAWMVNVSGTENIINSANKIGAHLIYISTDFIFSGNDAQYSENATAEPVNYYGQTKLAAEKLVKEKADKWSAVRTSLVYGANQAISNSNLVLWVVNSLKNNKAIKVVSDQFRCPTLAEDLAKGCLLIAQHNAEGIYNISGPSLYSVYEIAVETANCWGLDSSLISPVATVELNEPAKRPPRTYLSCSKAIIDFDYQATELKEGLTYLKSFINKLS